MSAGRDKTKFDTFEESVIAVILGMMTLITFANVIARYVFNSNILWALELTVFLFAWLVLLGASYCVKHTLHIGVDVVVRALPPGAQKIVSLIAVAACLAFSLLLLKGAWDYWAPFITTRAFYEIDSIPMPNFMQFLADWLNDGERYEKLPRFIPYFALPLGMALLTFRFAEAGWRVISGRQDLVIAGHEAEEMVEEASRSADDEPNAKES